LFIESKEFEEKELTPNYCPDLSLTKQCKVSLDILRQVYGKELEGISVETSETDVRAKVKVSFKV